MQRSVSLGLKRASSLTSSLTGRSFSSQAIDVHTHMYTPKYMNILRKRTDIPRVINIDGSDRLVILPGEDKEKSTNIGRPIGKEYFDVESKLRFMDVHGIEKSVISLANPWLDFLTGHEAESVAQELNDELQEICHKSNGRLYGFATLPVRNPKASIKEVQRLSSSKLIKGVILGTPGAGKGIDHDNMFDVLGEIEKNDYTIFLHPHYGIGNEHWHDTGHSLFLALGFPFETTVAVSRLIVTGRLDKLPKLKLLVAHAGAALPALIGRLDSCVYHDIAISNRLQHAPNVYLKRMYFDAISYNTSSLQNLIDIVGEDRIMFGTDNPFFPPPGEKDIFNTVWPSTKKVFSSIDALPGKISSQIYNETAKKLLKL